MKHTPFFHRLLTGIIAVAVFFISCEKNDPDKDVTLTDPVITGVGMPNGPGTSANMGASGGSLTSADGKLTVSVPQGALSSNTVITIQPISNEGPLGVGTAYRVTPEDIRFNQPIQLIFHYDDALLNGTPEDFLWVITQAGDRSWNAMLKSSVNKTAKTVTVSTTHFSDWALGKFIELALSPSSKTLRRGESVQLQVAGFARSSHSDDDELAALIPLNTDNEALRPLTPIPSVESRLSEFRVKGWALNSASAPVSGSSGSLSASGLSATYKAPNSRPPANPVAVSVSLESADKEGRKSSHMLKSNISVVDTDMYLLLTVDGKTYEYYQYGYNGAVPPDPDNLSIANSGIDGNLLSITGAHIGNGSNLVSSFVLTVANPANGTKALNCLWGSGHDEAQFTSGQAVYDIGRDIRTKKPGSNCDVISKCANITITFTDYEHTFMGRVAGYFSGVLYEDKPGSADNCENPVEHKIEGEFWLTRAN